MPHAAAEATGTAQGVRKGTTRFAQVAERLGSDHWISIVALAKAAIKRGRDDIARDVFAAADQPGLQCDYLRQQCIELTGAAPVPLRPASP